MDRAAVQGRNVPASEKGVAMTLLTVCTVFVFEGFLVFTGFLARLGAGWPTSFRDRFDPEVTGCLTIRGVPDAMYLQDTRFE
jgi:hypothetical protein